MKIRFLILLMLAMLCSAGHAARIKDIIEVQGERGNPLVGTGIVIGLNGTGDSDLASAQALISMIQREGDITFRPSDLASGSIALVQVTGELGPYKLEGSTMDVTVSTLGDCKSLQGGQLLPTPLKGLDNVVYAVTRALAISTASWTVESSATGSKIAKNHPTSGTIIGGAYVERSEVSQIIESIGGKRYVTFKLRNSDYTTIERIRKAVDEMYPGSGFVENAGTIHVRVPEEIGKNDDMMFVDTLLQLQVEVDMPAVIVINEKTGTIVVGGNVTISETAVAQGSLVVKIKEQSIVSQPGAPFTSGATTAIVPDTSISVVEDPGYLIRVPQTLTVSDLVDGLNAIGASPRDLIAIFNALKVAGALQAEIKMM